MNLSIGHRIGTGFAFLVLLSTILGFTCFISLQDAKTHLEEVQIASERSNLAATAALANRLAVTFTMAIFYYGEDKFYQQVQDEIDKMLAAQSRLITISSADKKAEAQQLLNDSIIWKNVLFNETFVITKAIARESAQGNAAAVQDLRLQLKKITSVQRPITDEMAVLMENIKNTNEELVQISTKRANEAIYRVIATALGTCLSTVILGTILSIIITRKIRRQMTVLLTETKKYANGDWRKSINTDSTDEFGELAATLNIMRQNTYKLIADLQLSDKKLQKINEELEEKINLRSAEIMTINKELTAANQQLITMYEEQAASNEEVIAMNENLIELNADLADMNEERFRRAIDFAPFPVMIHAEDGQVLRLSKAWTNITGYTRKDIPTVNDWLQKAYGTTASLVAKEIAPLYKLTFSVDNGEYTIKTKSGTTKIWRFSSSPLGSIADGRLTVISMAVDITENKEAEKKVQESEERYRAVIQQSSAAVAIVEPQTKIFVEVNQRWLDIFGYKSEEVFSLTIYDIHCNSPAILDAEYDALLKHNSQPQTKIMKWKRKDGRIFEGERSVSLIRYGNEKLYIVSTIRDISKERMIQQEISKDVALAAIAQKNLLPGGFREPLLTLETIYEPYLLVSGDFYGYSWSNDSNRFIGFILDISGHGVASAIRGFVISKLFRDILDSPMSLVKRLYWINEQVLHYFTDETFAAALCFEFNFRKKTLHLVTAGIYECLLSSAKIPTVIFKNAGSFIGLTENPEYEEHILPIHPGDAFYFMTDGIFENLPAASKIHPSDFDNTISLLQKIATKPDKKDDCSALCLKIADNTTLPVTFGFSIPKDRARIRTRILEILSVLVPQQAQKIDVALGEALNNAVRSGIKVQVKVKCIGYHLIIRIKDNGKGFAGNNYIATLKQQSDESIFEERLFDERGRGIPIILAWMDKVLYNRSGNEIMLLKNISL